MGLHEAFPVDRPHDPQNICYGGLLRIFEDWPIIIGGWSVPKSLSWIALIVAGGLALLGFRFAVNEED
jgi:hypothetical protein